MSAPSIIRRQPVGRRSIGFQLEVPAGLELDDGEVLTCREMRQDGRVAGELAISVLIESLIIDRDGVLSERACQALAGEAAIPGGATAVAVALPGASGFRAAAVTRGPLPYIYVFALAPNDFGVDGGVVITVRGATPDWTAAEHMLRTLRLVTRSGRLATETDTDDRDASIFPSFPSFPSFPIVDPPHD